MSQRTVTDHISKWGFLLLLLTAALNPKPITLDPCESLAFEDVRNQKKTPESECQHSVQGDVHMFDIPLPTWTQTISYPNSGCYPNVSVLSPKFSTRVFEAIFRFHGPFTRDSG